MCSFGFLRPAFPLPSMSLSLAKYESFLVNNVSTISSLESSLRSITWFLPGRFKDAELASEALTALMNATSMYHDTILAKVVDKNPQYRPLIPASLHTRYTRAWIKKSSQYKWSARILELLRFTELVMEMVFKRKLSEKTRWRGILAIETIKTILRLLLLKITCRPLLSSPLPERDFDPTLLPPSSAESSPTLVSSSVSSLPATPDHLRNNHLSLPPHALLTTSPPPMRSDMAVEEYLLPKALTTSSVKPSISLLKALSSPQEWLGEIIYVLRPFAYASLLAYDRRNKRTSNRALMTIFVMELVSRHLRRTPPASAALERSEYARRDKDMLWYLLRGSIWETYTRPKLESFVASASRAPLLGLFGVLVKEWIPLIDEYYYYTAP